MYLMVSVTPSGLHGGKCDEYAAVADALCAKVVEMAVVSSEYTGVDDVPGE